MLQRRSRVFVWKNTHTDSPTSSITKKLWKRKKGRGIQVEQRAIKCLHLVNYNIEQAFCALPFFFFCFGGWRTTLMAASNTAFTFCNKKNTTTNLNYVLNYPFWIRIYNQKTMYLLWFWAAFNVSWCINQLPQLFSLS
jgi:DUF1365 family protein